MHDDSRAWAALYEAYFDRVWRLVARRIGTDGPAVADVVQETFLAAARSADTFDPAGGTLWQWLGGIARHHVSAHFRRRHREGRIKESGDLHSAMLIAWNAQQGPDVGDPQAGCLAAELAAHVRSALAHLPDGYQALLTARYFDDVPVEQIARQTHSTVTAVRSQLARARRAFREVFSSPALWAHDGDGIETRDGRSVP